MRRPRGDDGAYAILYGLLLVVILGTAAVVVDLAAMREDRRQSRLASDSAAVAGARALNPLESGGSPFQACEDAWSYVATNMDVAVASPTNCTVFPQAFTSCPLTASTATATSDGVTVSVTWPVLQNSPLLTSPDVTGDTTITAQNVDPAVDGTAADACSRLGVTVKQVHEPLLAGLFGATDRTTTATSVARAVAVAGGTQEIASLNVLNQTTCYAIDMSGQAFLRIAAVGTRPGIIAVESNGHQQGNHCPNSNRWVINAASNAAGGYIRADGPGGVAGGGIIYSYALNAGANPAQAYNPAAVPPSQTWLAPRPTVLTERSGTKPITNYVACSAPCTTMPENYIGLLKARFGGPGVPTPYPYADLPYNGLNFVTLPGPTVPSFSCSIGNNAKVYLPPLRNYYLNCPSGLTVSGVLVVGGGTVVVGGGIDVAGGCFAMNVPLTSVPAAGPACPRSGGQPTSQPVTASTLYLRPGNGTNGPAGGNLTTSGSYSILMPRTFVYMSRGHLDVAANAQAVYWTNPRATDITCTSTTCLSQRFAKLALWNESTDQGQALGGQGALTMRGVLYLPNAKFTYTGQAAQTQTNAQFWTDTLEIKGQGGLTMAPDPDDSYPTPALGVVLIR